MSLLIKLAIRNASRNSKATLLNGIGITALVVILLLVFSLSRGIEHYIVRNNINFETGAVSIDLDKSILSHNNKEVGNYLLNKIEKVLKENREVLSYSFRIYPSNSLLYLEDNTQSINLVGLSDKEIDFFPEMLKITEGSNILPNSKEIIVSDGIAREFGLKIGEPYNIMLQTVDGTINLDSFILSGVFRYTSLANKFNIYMNYSQAMNLYNSNLPSKILIKLKDIERARYVKKELQDRLARNQSKDPLLEISSYEDHSAMAKSISSFNKYGMMSIAFFLVLISFVGIWSMQTENKITRKKENGTLLSFGFSRKSTRMIYIYESLYISILYTIIGVFLVLIVILAISANDGIYLGESASFAFGSSIILPLISWEDIVITALISVSYPFLATLLSINDSNKNIIEMI